MTPSQPPRDPLAPHSLAPGELQQLIAAQQRDGVFLAWRDRPGIFRIKSFEDDDARSWTIGRRTEMDVVIDDPQVSGLHARLQRDGAEWTVTDAGSTTGTFVNDQRVAARRLADSDRIRLGRTIVAFNGRLPAIEPTAPDDATPRIENLTTHQHRVLAALCRPLLEDARDRQPATNKQIADELHLSVGAVKRHLRNISEKFGVADLGQNEKRVRLAADAVASGIVRPQDTAKDR